MGQQQGKKQQVSEQTSPKDLSVKTNPRHQALPRAAPRTLRSAAAKAQLLHGGERAGFLRCQSALTTHTRLCSKVEAKSREDNISIAALLHTFSRPCTGYRDVHTQRSTSISFLNGTGLDKFKSQTTVFKCMRGRETQETGRIMGVLFSGEK